LKSRETITVSTEHGVISIKCKPLHRRIECNIDLIIFNWIYHIQPSECTNFYGALSTECVGISTLSVVAWVTFCVCTRESIVKGEKAASSAKNELGGRRCVSLPCRRSQRNTRNRQMNLATLKCSQRAHSQSHSLFVNPLVLIPVELGMLFVSLHLSLSPRPIINILHYHIFPAHSPEC
jgi:hypothetical protein